MRKTVVHIVKTGNFTKRDSQRSYSSEAAVYIRFQNKSFEKLLRIHKKTPPLLCFCNKVARPKPEFLCKRKPLHMCFSVIFVKVLRTLLVTTSYSSGRYPKTYLGTILKGPDDIN